MAALLPRYRRERQAPFWLEWVSITQRNFTGVRLFWNEGELTENQ